MFRPLLLASSLVIVFAYHRNRKVGYRKFTIRKFLLLLILMVSETQTSFRAECNLVLKEEELEPGRPVPKGLGCWKEDHEGEEREYCDLVCPNSHTVFIAYIDQGHRACFNYITYQIEKFKSDNEILARLRARARRIVNISGIVGIGLEFPVPTGCGSRLASYNSYCYITTRMNVMYRSTLVWLALPLLCLSMVIWPELPKDEARFNRPKPKDWKDKNLGQWCRNFTVNLKIELLDIPSVGKHLSFTSLTAVENTIQNVVSQYKDGSV
uniref:Secreted protein n=1 Tax=Heterorhabditis bacteriophora TaxID=37862 RepID=A0A1I7WT50_HETBA